jgi:hypothetical protein
MIEKLNIDELKGTDNSCNNFIAQLEGSKIKTK